MLLGTIGCIEAGPLKRKEVYVACREMVPSPCQSSKIDATIENTTAIIAIKFNSRQNHGLDRMI